MAREDDLDWLRCVLKRKPKYFGPVPVWTRRALPAGDVLDHHDALNAIIGDAWKRQSETELAEAA